MSQTSNAMLDRLLEPVGLCLAPEVAGRIIRLRAEPDVQDRIDDLAERAGDGRLTADEVAEYEAYIRAIDFITVLRAKARKVLATEAAV